MKRLYLLRHAKSSWSDPALDDHDRPLAARGMEAAPLIGARMRELAWVPALALCSPARRARETWNRTSSALEQDVVEELRPELYHAEADRLLVVVRGLDDGVPSVILIGHNPGFASLAVGLVNDHGMAVRIGKFPTAALAVFDLEIDSWEEAASGCGRLVSFIRPRDLGAC